MWRPPVSLNGLSLRELLPDALDRGERDARITGCSTVASACQPGDVFVAVGRVSEKKLRAALRRGVGAIVTSAADALESNGLELSIPTFRVADPQAALSRICQALAGSPSERLKVIGVTGAHGKTTTGCLLASILGVGGLPAGVLSTLAWFDGMETEAPHSPTLAPQALAPWLARMESNGCSHAVVEISQSVLRSSQLESVQFDSLCLSGLQAADWRFDTPADSVAEMEEQIARLLPGHGMLAMNADDAGCQSLLERLQHPTLTIGINNPAEIMAEIIEQTPYDQTFLLCAGSETIPVRTRLIGTHNVRNCLLAAAIALGYGLDPIDIVRGLERVDVISHRLQRVDCGQPFNVFVDVANNAAAMESALRTLHEVTQGRVICVFGAEGGSNDRFARPLLGRAVEKYSDIAVITAANSRDEDPADIIDDIADGFRGPVKPWSMLNREDAIRAALSLAREGDSVLIAGRDASIRAEQIGQAGGDDREIVRRVLDDLLPPVTPFRAAA